MGAFPGSADDSGLKRGAYIAEFDLLCPMVVVSLLVDIYCRRVTRLHLGPLVLRGEHCIRIYVVAVVQRRDGRVACWMSKRFWAIGQLV